MAAWIIDYCLFIKAKDNGVTTVEGRKRKRAYNTQPMRLKIKTLYRLMVRHTPQRLCVKNSKCFNEGFCAADTPKPRRPMNFLEDNHYMAVFRYVFSFGVGKKPSWESPTGSFFSFFFDAVSSAATRVSQKSSATPSLQKKMKKKTKKNEE